MFCGKCGAPNADNAEFCAECGTKLKKSQPTGTGFVPGNKNQNRKVGMIIVAAAMIFIVVLGVSIFGGKKGYKDTVQKFVDAVFNADAEGIIRLVPEEMIDYALVISGYDVDDREKMIDELQEELWEQRDTLESYVGDEWKISCDIISAEDITGDDLDAIKDRYSSIGVNVSASKAIEAEVTVKAKEAKNSDSLDIYLIKVGPLWYLDMMRMVNLY